MSCCVSTHAMLSALVRRVTVDGVLPPERDFEALRALGLSREEVVAAFARHHDPLALQARALVDRVWLAG